ncbi:cardiolipin synthase [Listeria fleischmannii]|jgi:cardiolipin synthase|uniref:Cardiolipin synthase n=2 Tax=Listeria fleischmannii TaxID=1069827 RepID=A0A841YFW5_9LIST|nr:cardiolipin synthase [Listeria fleischmannii]MBC1399332.1 cardiolipin synthase [Listeria fleischmannii]MBC1427734.1 cardiolipin synthase [Listeria fleischmannii]STY35780.1 Cardiolipin synthase [Listeria fleischmannii subsp. coloradonensis]
MKKRFQLIIIIALVLFMGFVLRQWSEWILYTAGFIVELIGVVIVIRLLFWDKRNTTSKVAWMAAVFILPVLGVFLYLFFGRNPQNRIFTHNQTNEMHKIASTIHHLPPYEDGKKPPHLSKRIQHLTEINPVNGNKLTLLTNGEETFPAIIEALKKAQNHIHIQYYIYKSDAIGQEIRDILIERANAGVEVRFMYDDWGSAKLSEHFLEPMHKAGIKIHAFDPIRSIWVARTANLRNHRKIIVIDGEIGFTGGLNIGEEYRSNTPDFVVWRDTHIQVEGMAVIELQESFLVDWVYMENKAGAADGFISEAGIGQYFSPKPAGNEWAQVVYGGPYDKEKYVRDAILDLMDSAKESVWITSPYFVPDEEALAVIRRVALSGIDVRIILPGKGDRGISFNGSNSNIETMLDAGAKVYAYRDDSFVHAKLLLIDGERGAVGTANFDIRSFRLNHELMIFLYERDQAIVKMERDFEADFKVSKLYTMEDIRKKSWYVKMKENLSSLLSPIL